MPGSVDGPSEPPMAPGTYMDSHTVIKLRLEVAVPLVTPHEVATKPYLPVTIEVMTPYIVSIVKLYQLDRDGRNPGVELGINTQYSYVNRRFIKCSYRHFIEVVFPCEEAW